VPTDLSANTTQCQLRDIERLHRAWPQSRLFVVEDAGHAAGECVGEQLVEATDGFR
jgi:proline iminopeptidase